MNNIIKFYLDSCSIKEQLGFSFVDIMNKDDDWLEGCHNHIQWLFPLTEPSNFNPDAPLLTQEDIDTFHELFLLQSRLLNATHKMTIFFYNMHWLTPHNHNFLRITRIIKCLKLLLPEHRATHYATQFYNDIVGMVDMRYNDKPEWLNEPMNFWRNALLDV